MNQATLSKIEDKLDLNIKTNESMANHTTLKVGGPAEYFVEVNSKDKLIETYKIAKKENIPVFVLGGGSNILVGDKGIKGLVIKNKVLGYESIKQTKIQRKVKNEEKARKNVEHWRKDLLQWVPDYIEDTNDGVILEVLSGTPLSYLINKTLDNGYTGLQWFVRIPGTFGGAVWNNIHGAEWHIGDFIEEIKVIDVNGCEKDLKRDQLSLKYNETYFQKSGDLIISAKLFLYLGDKEKALQTLLEWKDKKSIQPLNSAGSTFGNLSEDQKKQAGLENGAAGYIIDKVLGMRGYKVGNTMISEKHCNFIETNKASKASEVLQIIEEVKSKAKSKLGIDLKEEIVKVGQF